VWGEKRSIQISKSPSWASTVGTQKLRRSDDAEKRNTQSGKIFSANKLGLRAGQQEIGVPERMGKTAGDQGKDPGLPLKKANGKLGDNFLAR